MNIERINPYVRFARIQNARMPKIPTIALDHRLFYCTEGHATVFVDEKEYCMIPGAFIFWKSGLVYRFADESKDFSMVGCNFDLYKNDHAPKTPVSYIKATDFDKSMLIEHIDSDSIPDCMFLNYAAFERVLKDILYEYSCREIYYEAKCSALLKDILITALRMFSLGEELNCKTKPDVILQFIREHYNEKLTNSRIAGEFFYHPNYISNLIKKRTGLPLHKYLLQYRIHMASVMLQSTDKSITDIAHEVGFDDIKHFSKSFKKITGIPPSAYNI